MVMWSCVCVWIIDTHTQCSKQGHKERGVAVLGNNNQVYKIISHGAKYPR